VIKLSVKTLAKYMTAGPAAQRKVLQDAKYRDEDQPRAMRQFYQETCQTIEAFHRGLHDREWLARKAEELGARATATGGQSEQRLWNNVRAVRHYSQHFADRQFTPLTRLRLRLEAKGVVISMERGKQKAIKFDFARQAPDPHVVRIVSQCMYEASAGYVENLNGASILYMHVARGTEHRGAKSGARTTRDVEAACETIAAVWESIPPPRRRVA
jgi:hypothetical protein